MNNDKYLLVIVCNFCNYSIFFVIVRVGGPMFINLLLPNYPLLQIKNNIMAAANRLFLPNYLHAFYYFPHFVGHKLVAQFVEVHAVGGQYGFFLVVGVVFEVIFQESLA